MALTTGTFVLKQLQDHRDGTQLVWRTIVDGTIISAEFNCKGAAEAAINVERARRTRRVDSAAKTTETVVKAIAQAIDGSVA